MSTEPDMLPTDSDIEVADTSNRPRPVHLRPALLLLVVIGGACGTAARELISTAVPVIAALPIGVFAINLTGAFALGLLLEFLARSGPDEGLRQRLRLLLGTGFCGGFTTYSSLAAASATLITAGATAEALLYGAGTIVLGGLTSLAGIAVASAIRRRLDQ